MLDRRFPSGSLGAVRDCQDPQESVTFRYQRDISLPPERNLGPAQPVRSCGEEVKMKHFLAPAVRSPLPRRVPRWAAGAAALAALALVMAGGGSSGTPSKSSSAQAKAHAGGTFTILANSAFGVADPSQNYTLEEWQLLIDTHDGLVGFAHVGGIAGTKIVPDLATSIPVPTNGGKTYLFHIRRGIKFSNGQTLKPSDFVTTFERQFTVPGPTAFYSGIVGASVCSPKEGCNLSKGVVAHDSAYTLPINLTAPDPELMDQLSLPFAYAVPASTPLKLTGNNVPPGTGPYMWKSYNPNTQAVLVRNPHTHATPTPTTTPPPPHEKKHPPHPTPPSQKT